MTSDEFKKLSPSAQEAFINDGGVVISQQSGIAGSVAERQAENRTVDSSLHYSDSPSPVVECSKDGCHSPSTQLAPPFPCEASQPVSQLASQPPNSTSATSSTFDGFLIDSPVELLFLLDKNISSGSVTLHPWQIQVMLDFATGIFTDNNPFQALVRACNGSGKDKYIIASCAVWLSMRWKKSLSIVTSSSGAQLDNQTCRYIKALAESANRWAGTEIWSCKYREYSIDFGDGFISYIFSFATDEPKKAEGYHPIESGAKMAIFTSEDKSIPDDINVALNKCTGYTHRLHVSTPGSMMGHFYEYSTIAIPRSSIKSVTELTPTDWLEYHVTAFDCSHISKSYIEQMKRDLPGHEHGAAYKSQVLAEFGTTDEMVVIPSQYVWKACRNPVKGGHIAEPFNKAGLDLSDGGDETVLVIRNGNKHLKTIPFKFDNTEDTIAFLNEAFKDNNLTSPEALIYADMGGLGKPMLDRMRRQGWSNIRYIDNRTKALRPATYKNRGSELWFHIRDLMEHHELILINEPILIRQLSTRFYKLLDGRVHQLLSKLESKSRGYPSPDRADAFTLAFWDYKSTFVPTTDSNEEQKPFEEPEVPTTTGDFNQRAWANNSQKRWVANGGHKDFSELENEIANYNRNRQLTN